MQGSSADADTDNRLVDTEQERVGVIEYHGNTYITACKIDCQEEFAG